MTMTTPRETRQAEPSPAPPAEDTVEDSDLLERAFRDPRSGLSTTAPQNAWIMFKLWYKDTSLHAAGRKLRTARGDAQRLEGWVRARQHIAGLQQPTTAETQTVSRTETIAGVDVNVNWGVVSIHSVSAPGDGDFIKARPDVIGDPDTAWVWQAVQGWQIVGSGSAGSLQEAISAAQRCTAVLSLGAGWEMTDVPAEVEASFLAWMDAMPQREGAGSAPAPDGAVASPGAIGAP